MSIWSDLPTPVPDLIFKLSGMAKVAEDPKINLVIGAYRDENGQPYVLPVVKKAELEIVMSGKYNKEYLPIDGFKPFCDASVELILGADIFKSLQKNIARAQSLSGTGAVRLCAEFLARTSPQKGNTPIYLSKPTWPNHKPILVNSGFKNICEYAYFNKETNGVDIEGMLRDMNGAPEGSIFLIHECAHNPTGADPTHEQWAHIADVVEKKKLMVLFDCAYQGYASGNLEHDAYPARLFAKRGIEFCIAQSFAKNMGLYGERVGCASVVTRDASAAAKVQGVLKNIIRPMYSNPPAHGARLAHLVMTDAAMRKSWETEMKGMADRIIRMRKALYDELVRLETPGSWTHITKQIGMFSYLGLSEAQCQQLVDRRVFLMPSSRISVAGLTSATAKSLAAHMNTIIRKI